METMKTQRENGTFRVMSNLGGESRTEQSHRKKCNINTIVGKIRRGQMVPFNVQPGQFGDFSQVGTFQDALNKVMEVETHFRSLPSDVRRKFQNNPQALIQFMDKCETDEEARKEARKMGLLKPEQPPKEPENVAPGGSQTPETPPEGA